MVLVDTDVLLIDYRYPRDRHFTVNSAFLTSIRSKDCGITIYNLMEFLGQMSFGTSTARLARWPSWLQNEYGFRVIWPEAGRRDAESFFRDEMYDRPFSKMLDSERGMAFYDALIIGLAERTPFIDVLVTWNARHFRGKTALQVMTPEEYVQHL